MFSLQLRHDTVLRPLAVWHAEEFAAHMDQVREHIRPWVGPSFVTDNVDGARNTIRRYADRQAADSGGLYGIWSHGDLVGGVMFTRFCEAEGMCEVGCWVCPEFEGRGLVTEACRVLIDWAFIDRGLHRAEWHCRADNDRSIAVAKRLGMTLEGVMRSSWPYQGVRYDTQVWAVLAHEWRSRCGDHTKRPHGPEPRHARTDCFRAPSICELCVYDLALFDSPRATLQASPGGTQHRSCPISATFFVNSMFTHGTRPATCSLGVKQPRKPCRRGALNRHSRHRCRVNQAIVGTGTKDGSKPAIRPPRSSRCIVQHNGVGSYRKSAGVSLDRCYSDNAQATSNRSRAMSRRRSFIVIGSRTPHKDIPYAVSDTAGHKAPVINGVDAIRSPSATPGRRGRSRDGIWPPAAPKCR
ncbi:MAG TPA: GNAT family N-acetyltransferase [Candidatus Stackebrandtia excrementipullorum]|nr:GNAT family N-acetyltransferase [Candidatus Stackebrandtia excrementipullorum]